MGLADDVGSLVSNRPETVEKILARLDTRDRDALLGVLTDREHTHNAVAAWLTKHGYKITKNGVAGWRARNGWNW